MSKTIGIEHNNVINMKYISFDIIKCIYGHFGEMSWLRTISVTVYRSEMRIKGEIVC